MTRNSVARTHGCRTPSGPQISPKHRCLADQEKCGKGWLANCPGGASVALWLLLPLLTLGVVRESKAGEPGEPSSVRLSVIDSLQNAAEAVDESRFPNPEASTQRLADAISRVERYIGVETANGQAWSKFLRLDSLKEQLAKENRASLTELADIATTMRQNYSGLETPAFLELRGAVDGFVAARKFGKPESAIGVLAKRSEQAIASIEAEDGRLSAEQLHMIARLAGYYVESGQNEAANALLSSFRQPNVDVKVEESFINRLIGRGIAEPRDVNECLLGTRIVGTACLTGQISVDLTSMTGGAAVRVNFSGNMTSQNRGYNRGVMLRSSGAGTVNASKQLWASMTGITSDPASASGNLRTTIHSIYHKSKLVTRIARRKAAQTKPQVDAIARGRLRSRLSSSYDEQVDVQLGKANASLAEFNGPAPVATRFDLPRPKISLASTDTKFLGSALAGSVNQIAAPQICPLPEPTTYGVVFKLHQTAVTNYLDRFLSGRVLKSDTLDDLAEQILGEAPEELEQEALNEQWMIRMDTDRPVDLSLDGGRVKLSIKMKEIKGKQGDIKASSAAVTYVPLWGDGQLILQREGEIETDFGRAGIKGTAMRSVLRKKFEEIFKPEVVVDIAKLSEQYPALRELELQELQVDQQWLQAVLK